MATGVTSVKKKGEPVAKASPVTLHYEGKTPPEEVLALPVPIIKRVKVPRNYGGEGRLYFGENLSVLSALAQDPEVKGKVRLVYIDPPFATRTAFHSRSLVHAYEDTLIGSEFIEFIRQRLILLHSLLAEDGSLYFHLDEKMIFHCKLVLDEIFGASNFRNCIVRKKCNPKNYTRKQFGNISDYILFYTKGPSYVWNRPVEEWTEERAKEYQYVEEGTGRRFMKVPVHAPGLRNGATGQPWRGMMPPPGKHWQYTPEKLDEYDAKGEIFWSSNGNPRRKVYLDENRGIGVQDIWMDFRDAHNQNVCITGYPTEKNPQLLRRIIKASSNLGDLVLDAFSGSGTTIAVSSEEGRRWIGIDNSQEAVETMLKRFANGLEKMGDFVGKRGKKSAEQVEMPFEVGGHAAITDFEFLATSDCYSTAVAALKAAPKPKA